VPGFKRMRASASGLLLLSVLLGGSALAHDKPKGAPVVLAPGYSKLNYAAPAPGSYQLPPIQAAADARYIDSKGQPGQLHTLYAGRVTLLSFIYTHCDDVNGCPLASFVMGQIAKRLKAVGTTVSMSGRGCSHSRVSTSSRGRASAWTRNRVRSSDLAGSLSRVPS
jgi:cytochrome oxidase Cu insertion factor (SCO1/SenC/PrrC family)